MKKLLYLFFLINSSLTIQGQAIKIDTAKHVNFAKKIKVYSKEDSLRKFYKIIPRTATIRSAMVPGWGQIYNRQYWKLPLVAGAFAVNIYFIVYNDTRYHYYRGYLGQTYPPQSLTTVNVPLFNNFNEKGEQVFREFNQATLNNAVAGYRKNRDGSYLILLAVWAANIVDANVTAHLKTFDMTDDISLRIQPNFSSPDIMEPILGAKLVLAFK